MKDSTNPGCFPPTPPSFPGPYRKPTSLPTGKWHMLANGRIFILEITSVTGSSFTANFSSGSIADGSWDAARGIISFIRITTIKQRYVGYLLHYDDADPKWRIAGTFGNVEVGTESGWYATLPK